MELLMIVMLCSAPLALAGIIVAVVLLARKKRQ